MAEISWTLAKLTRFKKAYQAAKQQDAEVFQFEGYEFVLDYAKYLIEYLEDQFNAD